MRNPYLIGIVPGVGPGAVTVLVPGASAGALTGAAFVGPVAAFARTVRLAGRRGDGSPTRLVLSGIAAGNLSTSTTLFLQTQASPTELQRVLFWSLGSNSGAEWFDLPIAVVATVAGTTWPLIKA